MTPQGQHQLEFPTSGGHDPNGDRATADIDVGVIGDGGHDPRTRAVRW